MLKKKLTLLSAAFVLMLTFLVSGCGQVKIGYIDGEKVMSDAPQIKSLLEEADKKILEAQKELEAEAANSSAADDEEKQKKQMEGQRKLMSLNQQYSAQLKQKMDTVMAEIAKEKELDVVLESVSVQKSVLHGGVDVTDDVIKKLQ